MLHTLDWLHCSSVYTDDTPTLFHWLNLLETTDWGQEDYLDWVLDKCE